MSIASGPVQLAYRMSPAGDVREITDGNGTRSFTYDFLGRLVSAPGWLAYAYDGAGNRTAESSEGASSTYTYSFDRVYAQRVPSGTTTTRKLIFGHDSQTNVASIAAYDPPDVSPKRAVCLRHDALGRLTSVGTASPGYAGSSCWSDAVFTALLARYKYDFRGRRVARWNPATSQWTYFVHGPDGSPLEELARTSSASAPWVPRRGYAWLREMPLAQLEYPAQGAPRVYAIHADHLGLPRALTSPAGATVWSAATRPFGEVVETIAPDPETGATVVTNLRLPGQYDERLFAAAGLSGLQGPYYNWNRWYLPSVGRYLELDPIALRGHFNARYVPDWYNYALGNPLRYTDPLGLYGTNDCSYYEQRCAESGGKYYCDQAQYWCNKFPKYPDPDPNRDDDYEGWARCTRQCLQDCDRDENRNQNSCPPTPDQRKGPWDPRSSSFQCHVKCYTACALGGDKYGHPDTDY